MHVPARRRRRARLAATLLTLAGALVTLPTRPAAAATTATSTTLTSNGSPSTYGQPVTLTATVTVTDGTAPTGTVSFVDNGSVVGTASVAPAQPWQATYTTAALAPGAHSLSAVYGGDGGHAPSTSTAVSQTVTSSATTVSLYSSVNPSTPDQQVTLTANVYGFAGIPDFSYAGASGDPVTGGRSGYILGDRNSITVSGSTASLTVAISGRESWSITLSAPAGQQLTKASYAGATLPSTPAGSAPGLEVHSQGPACTTVSGDFSIQSIETAPDGSVRGIRATFDQQCNGSSATLQGNVHVAAAAPPSGTVAFRDGSTLLGTGTLDGTRYAASVAVPNFSSGRHTVSAEYSGDQRYSSNAPPSGTAVITQQVGPVPTVTLTSTPNPSVRMTDVSFTVTVSSPAGAPVGTGGVTVYVDGAASLGNSLDANGRTSVTDGVLDTGQHTITAFYGGDAVTQGASSATLTQTVDATPGSVTPVMTLTTSASRVASGDHVTIGVSLLGPQGNPSPAGTVHFLDGQVSESPVELVNGQGSLDYVAGAPGAHTLTARFDGDGTYAAASSTISETVTGAAPTALTLTASSSPSVPGQQVTLVAVAAAAEGGTPTGSVTFSDEQGAVGTVALDSTGTAVIAYAPSPGTHQLSATYEGDGTYAASSDSITQSVVAATPNRRFVNQLYNDILGRPATDADASPWVSLLDRNAIDHTHVALALSTSTEFISDAVEASYLGHLGRDADPQGLAFWVDYIHRGATLEDLEISFLGTPEYYAGAPALFPNLGLTPPQAFVYAVYKDVLGRDPDPAGLAYWVIRLGQGDPAWHLAASVVKSTEAMSNRVTAYYFSLLGRAPDAQGLASWTSLLQHGTRDETLLAELAGSTEYWNDTQAY